MKQFKMSWYADAFRVPFTGTKGPSPAAFSPTPYSHRIKLYTWHIKCHGSAVWQAEPDQNAGFGDKGELKEAAVLCCS